MQSQLELGSHKHEPVLPIRVWNRNDNVRWIYSKNHGKNKLAQLSVDTCRPLGGLSNHGSPLLSSWFLWPCGLCFLGVWLLTPGKAAQVKLEPSVFRVRGCGKPFFSYFESLEPLWDTSMFWNSVRKRQMWKHWHNCILYTGYCVIMCAVQHLTPTLDSFLIPTSAGVLIYHGSSAQIWWPWGRRQEAQPKLGPHCPQDRPT